MNKEDILKILEGAKDKNGDVPMRLVRLAFKKLPEPCTDTISRRAAIDALMEILDRPNHAEFLYTDEICKALGELPSAQSEVIRCKDCVHSDAFSEGADNDMPLKCLGIRYGGVMPDWYCEHAERKTYSNGRD